MRLALGCVGRYRAVELTGEREDSPMSVHKLLFVAVALAVGCPFISCADNSSDIPTRPTSGAGSSGDGGARGGAPPAGSANAGTGGASAVDAGADSSAVVSR